MYTLIHVPGGNGVDGNRLVRELLPGSQGAEIVLP